MKRGILVILILVIFISGCISNIQSSFGQQIKTTQKGISMELLQHRPPLDEIYDNQNFQVAVKLVNNAGEDATGQICVSDTISDYFGGIPLQDCQSFNLIGAEPELTADQSGRRFIKEDIEFYFPGEGSSYSYTNIESKMDTTINVEIEYDYSALFTPQICISSKQECKDSSFNLLNPSTPVVITKMNKKLIPSGGNSVNVILELFIENVGGGEVFEDLVDFELDLVGLSNNFNCRLKTNQIELKDNKRTLICETNLEVEQKFDNPLEIFLRYKYINKITTGKIPLRRIEEI